MARPWPGGEKRRDGQVSHHEEFEAIRLFLLPCATTELSLIAMWRLSGATSRGQPWTPAVTRPHGRDGLSARRMAVLWTFREPSLCRHVHRKLLRKAALNLTLIIPTTACHQRNYVERYSRFMIAYRVERLCCLIIRIGHNCPKTPPVWAYQGKMTYESMVRRKGGRSHGR